MIEFTADLCAVSGILQNASLKCGDLQKIRFRGGNEEKIIYVVVEIRKFLTNKNYYKDDVIQEQYEKQLEDLTFFLTVNTEFSKPIDIEEYLHLNGTMPTISRCLLANLIVGLELSKSYCTVLYKFPFHYLLELVGELIPCLQKVILSKQLNDTFMILKAMVLKIMNSVLKKEDLENLEDLTPIVRQLSRNFSGINSDDLQNMRKRSINEHIGNAFMSILDLLLFCDHTNTYLLKIIKEFIETSIAIAKCVTINIYCDWAEIDGDYGQTLQAVIAGKSYMVIEKYNKYQPAKELIQMISTFAVKPKSLRNIIQEADTSTVINMVNKADSNQKQWFQTLIHSQVFANDDSKKCLSKWSSLCSEDDVMRLLNLCAENGNVASKDITLKCAANLHIAELVSIITKHFYKHGFIVLKENVQGSLVIAFNKLEQSVVLEDNMLRELLLMLLQSPEYVLIYIYNECLRNEYYVSTLHDFFSLVVDILKIHSFGLNCLLESIKKCPPCDSNYSSYSKLLSLFSKKKHFTAEVFMLKVCVPSIEHFLINQNYGEVKQFLRTMNDMDFTITLNENMEVVYKLFLDLLKLRTKFTNFNTQNQSIVQEVVMLLSKKHYALDFDQDNPDEFKFLNVEVDDDNFILFYKQYLKGFSRDIRLLGHFHGNFTMKNHSHAVCCLLQILPCCVTEEWFSVSSEIESESSIKELIIVLKDVIVLLCHMAQKQENTIDHPTLLNGLRYCVQHFGLIMKKVVIPKLHNVDDETMLTEAIIDLLCHLPQETKEEEGLSLLSLMSDRSLKNKNGDKTFICKMCMIKDTRICQILAQKMLT